MRAIAASAILFSILSTSASANISGPDSFYTGNANEYSETRVSSAPVRHARTARRSHRDRHAYRWSKRQGGTKVASLGPVNFAASSSLVERARAHLGKSAGQLGLPGSLWCADFVNRVTGGGTGSRTARSYLGYGTPGTGAVGDIAVFSRGRNGGGHVGIVAGHCSGGIVLISGNDGGRVRERCVSTASLIAYRRP
jgi:uncharacterized protein (TIGR02594 family)